MSKTSKKPKLKLRKGVIWVLVGVVIFGLIWKRVLEIREPNRKEPVVEIPQMIKNDYDFSKYYIYEDDYLHYDDDNYTSCIGIDVSQHNGVIDWTKIKDQGVSFVYIRCGYRGYEGGVLHEDTRHIENSEGALANGLDVGVYFVTQAIDEKEAVAEAKFVLDLVKGYKVKLPIVLDAEYATDHDRIRELTPEQLTANAVAFSEYVRKKGKDCMIYASAAWLQNEYQTGLLQDKNTFWVASYGHDHNPYQYQYDMWQYSNIGELEGISGPVDINIMLIKK